MLKLFTILIAFFAITTTTHSQITESEIDELIKTGSEQKLVSENSRFMQEDYFYFANKIATKLLSFNTTSCNYNYRKGYGVLYSEENPTKAKQHFEIAIKNTNSNFDAYSKNEVSAPMDAYFHYAVCLHRLGEFQKAIENFNIFKEKSKKQSELLPLVDVHLAQINEAKIVKATDVNIKNVAELNSPYPEFTSNLSIDGKLLFFTSRREWPNGESDAYRDRKFNFPTEDAYFSTNDGGTFQQPTRIKNSNPAYNESHITLSVDEREMIFYSDSTGAGDLYTANVARDLSSPRLENGLQPANTEFWETHAVTSQDHNTVYFVSDRPGGFGGRDIYKSVKGADGNWSPAINLGTPINTKYDEDAPFLSFDETILYFANNGPTSIGGFDIFYSKLESEGKWGNPVNMGSPINSTFDDAFYNTTIDGKSAFFSSNRIGGQGNLDIYQVGNITPLSQVAVFKGIIKTSTGEPLPEDVKLDFVMKCPDCTVKEEKMTLVPNLRENEFYYALEPCRSFQASMYNYGGSEPFQEETFMTGCDLSYQEIVREFIYDMEKKIITPVPVITPVDTVPVTVAYENVEFIHYFDYNKNNVSTKDAKLATVLKKINDQMVDGRQKITINIYSSASQVPTTTFKSNEKLAKLRAENLKKELESYFVNSANKNKITIKITTAVVDGPSFKKDAQNKGKYRPYQFVGIKTE